MVAGAQTKRPISQSGALKISGVKAKRQFRLRCPRLGLEAPVNRILDRPFEIEAAGLAKTMLTRV